MVDRFVADWVEADSSLSLQQPSCTSTRKKKSVSQQISRLLEAASHANGNNVFSLPADASATDSHVRSRANSARTLQFSKDSWGGCFHAEVKRKHRDIIWMLWAGSGGVQGTQGIIFIINRAVSSEARFLWLRLLVFGLSVY